MRRPIKRVWSAEEDGRLRQLAERGASKVRISLALKRPPHAVILRARKLGVTIKQPARFRFDPSLRAAAE
jgi:hypothetical protein